MSNSSSAARIFSTGPRTSTRSPIPSASKRRRSSDFAAAAAANDKARVRNTNRGAHLGKSWMHLRIVDDANVTDADAVVLAAR